jgi:hypothetical protein
LEDKLEMRAACLLDRKRLANYIFVYPDAATLETVFDSLEKAFESNAELAVCVGIVSGKGIVAFVRRRSGQKVVPIPTAAGHDAECYILRRHGQLNRCLDSTVELLSKAMGTSITNLSVQTPPGEYGFQQISSAVSRFTEEQLAVLKGEILVLPVKERSEFQAAFLRVFGQLTRVKNLADRGGKENIFNAFSPPDNIKIPPLGQLVNLNTEGSRLQEVSMQTETYTLMDVFTRSE